MALPAWAEALSKAERRVAHRVEQILCWLMLLIPLTGLRLVLASGEHGDLAWRGEWQALSELVDDDILRAVYIVAHLACFGHRRSMSGWCSTIRSWTATACSTARWNGAC